jgi:hypothetical protein
MGMYDTIEVSAAASLYLPDPFSTGDAITFQTKNVEQMLLLFELVPGANGLEFHYASSWTGKTELYKWTGNVCMYPLSDKYSGYLYLKVVDGLVLGCTCSEKVRDISIECPLVDEDEKHLTTFREENDRICKYLLDKYGMNMRFFESFSERLFELEGRKCLDSSLEWMFNRRQRKNDIV